MFFFLVILYVSNLFPMEYLNNEKNDSDSKPEIFEAFIYKFMEDSIFQLSRIKFLARFLRDQSQCVLHQFL